MRYDPIIPGYSHILHGGDYNPDQWLDMPEIIDEDFRLMRLAGCNTFSVGIFSWTTYEPREGEYDFAWLQDILDRMAQAGNKVFLATPSGAKPSWMARKYPEIRRVLDHTGIRQPQKGRHNHCLSSPVFREKVRLINTELARRFGHHPAVGGWHISNELGGDCFCENCLARYREFLKKKYGTLEKLNRDWYTSFWNMNIRDWEEINPFLIGDGPQLDWKRFVTEQYCEWLEWEKAPLKAANPALPVTTNFMGFFDGVDYYRLAEHIDFVCDDVYPEWYYPADEVLPEHAMRVDQQRAMKHGRPPLIMESCPGATNGQRYGYLKRPGIHRMQELMAISQGCDGTLYFQWRKSRGSCEKTHGAVVDHVGHEHTRMFREVADLGALYKKLDDLPGSPVKVETALIYDQESCWALNITQGPSKETEKDYLGATRAHYRALWKKNIPLDVIEARADFSRYRLLVLPQLFLLHNDVARRLTQFVENGGTLVLTYLSAYVDERNQFFLGGLPGDGLKELTGVWNEEIDGLTPDNKQTLVFQGKEYPVEHFAEIIHPQADTEVLATYGAEFYAGTPALTCRRAGKGKVYYLAAKTGDDFLSAFYAEVLKGTDVAPTVAHADAGVHAARRENAGGDFLFLFNCDAQKTRTAELPAGRFRNVESGEISAGRIELPPLASWVLREVRE